MNLLNEESDPSLSHTVTACFIKIYENLPSKAFESKMMKWFLYAPDSSEILNCTCVVCIVTKKGLRKEGFTYIFILIQIVNLSCVISLTSHFVKSCGVAESEPSCHWDICRVHPGQVTCVSISGLT